jgi:hypothetical protein
VASVFALARHRTASIFFPLKSSSAPLPPSLLSSTLYLSHAKVRAVYWVAWGVDGSSLFAAAVPENKMRTAFFFLGAAAFVFLSGPGARYAASGVASRLA